MKKRATWFPFYFSMRNILKRLSHEECGEVVMIALDSFFDGEVPEEKDLTDMQKLALDEFLDAIADAQESYQNKVKAGRKGGLAKSRNQKETPKENTPTEYDFAEVPDDLEETLEIPF